MPATPKSLRQPPPRNFEDYSLTYETSPELGLFPLRNEEMEYVPGSGGGSGDENVFSSPIDIGFTLNICGIDCDKATVSTYGWCALTTPGTNFADTDYFNSGDIGNPKAIFLINNGALLAPWFSAGIQNVYRYFGDAVAAGDLSATEGELLSSGRIDVSPVKQRWIDSSTGGIKFHRGSCSQGRYLLIRWHSTGMNVGIFKSTLKFDLVMYENGVVEYRYAPIDGLVSADLPRQTAVGVWLPQANEVYRDFSNYLKSDTPATPNTQRGKYRRGGAIFDNPAYLDNVSPPRPPYSVSLNHTAYWPAKGNNGAIFRFAPPISKRRNNRRTITARDSKQLSSAGSFDDRKTTYFVADTVSYPAGLPIDRPYTTSYKGVHSMLDLFSLGDLELSRTGSGGMYDQLLEETPLESPNDGFRELGLHEQGRSDDPFFSEGSSIFFGEVPGGLSGELSGKEILRLTLPIKVSTTMLGLTSSIYYYNMLMGRWNVPTGALGDLTSQFEAFSFDTRWTPAYGTSEQQYTPGSAISEDARGFDAYGRPISSGSSDVYRNVSTASFPGEFNQTIPILGQRLTDNRMMLEAISKPYGKSLPQNVDYLPTQDEMFTAPIQQPFLLEKAVFELPLAAGAGWFIDRTTTSAMLVSGVYSSDGLTELNRQLYIALDRGGPALTLALFCQKSGPTGTMELIASGTIIPAADTRSAGVCSIDDLRYSPTPTLVLGQTGIVCPAATVTPVGGRFTGSVSVPLTAAVSNGTTTALIKSLSVNPAAPSPPVTSTWNDASILAWISGSFSTATYTVTASSRAGENIVTLGVNSLGRAQAGFIPGGGSAFGGDVVTYARSIEEESSIVENPFYIPNEASRLAAYSVAVSKLATLRTAHPTSTLSFLATGDVETQGSRPSPYLLNPGDKLVLAVSKTRPATHFVRSSVTGSAAADVGRGRAEKVLRFNANCILADVVPHDVTLITGSINVSLYGSYIGNGMKRGV